MQLLQMLQKNIALHAAMMSEAKFHLMQPLHQVLMVGASSKYHQNLQQKG
jgi:hypothetical protein